MNEVLELLENLNIKYDIVKHPAAWTTWEADKYIEGYEGVPSKSMFMAGKKDRNFYLIILDENKRLDIKTLNEIVGDKLHFGKEEHLKEKMNLVPGIVSLFGLINNKDHDIKVYIDSDLLNEKIITFHPNDNTSTVFIEICDMFKFLKHINYDYEIIEL